ncbi:MAG: pyridoxamine 5'-phosphate oxidase [Bacteroidales bacterium]|nr:pyridoxamine 5'-phosphate oxidase [Bacteroidales bacterium]MCF8386850.1 pyridoxamine 5'-phosphate oxidase [Bacteroidales bacterium]MCF8399268.1 pyridoxamine 5'-phosphate oxidase [Bacteroidales bacterium]
MTDLRYIREEYRKDELSKAKADQDPIRQFDNWMKEALEAQLLHPTAMTLSTCGKDRRPSSRIVLLKDIDEKGFVFYTNYLSRKGREIIENPFAALLFFWNELERQVRIEGSIEKAEADQADVYFASRPLKSRISAAISEQSSEVPSRKYLENRFQEFRDLHPVDFERPEFWGAYRLIPAYFEFWQGREDRLHDRIAYELKNQDAWSMKRLAP